MKRIFLLLLAVLLLTVVIGCEKEAKSAADGHDCIECGKPATHYCGSQPYGNSSTIVKLYYCDPCYDHWVDELYESDMPIINGDFYDPENFGKRVN